jgi:hypothetical protein
MTRIRTLKANVTREQAVEQFSASGISRLFRNGFFGPLRSVAEFYVPFRLFRAPVVNGGATDENLVALDVVNGTLDLFKFDHIPDESEMMHVETRNCAAPALENERATDLLVAKLRRVLYSRGFFRMRGLSITATPLADELFVPYWLGFRGSGNDARVSVVAVVFRNTEGAKLHRLGEQWIATLS